MKFLNKTLYLLFFGLLVFQAPSAYAGKIGEKISDKGDQIILHKVEKGQTLFALSRLYNITVDEILDANPGMGTALNVGQVVNIPKEKKEEAAAPKATIKKMEKAEPAATNSNKTHTVEASETLYSISKLYNVSVDDIKKWNAMESPALNVGMELKVGENKVAEKPAFHVVKKGETLYAIANDYGSKVEDIRKWNKLEGYELELGQRIAVKAPDENREIMANQVNVKEGKDEFTTTYESGKVVQKGLAQKIMESGSTSKHLCLHKTAPKGTILQVKNEMNGSVVFVRVIGKLPETAVNDNTLVRLSEVAYDKLGPENKRFPVEVMYIP